MTWIAFWHEPTKHILIFQFPYPTSDQLVIQWWWYIQWRILMSIWNLPPIYPRISAFYFTVIFFFSQKKNIKHKSMCTSFFMRLIYWLTCGEPMQSRGVRRRCPSSVSRASFVTAGAIDPKLCTYVPLGKSNFGPVWFLVWPPGGQNRKHPELMAGSSPNFYHRYI
jgi:hypothetical protein